VKKPEPAWQIGTLRLRVPHMAPADARWIGGEVARRLAGMPAPARSRGLLELRVPADASGMSREQIVARIVRGVVEGCE
jgi:hypothetical protein